MFCTNCSTQNNSGGQFCVNCGTSIQQATQLPVQQPVVVHSSTQPVSINQGRGIDKTVGIIVGLVAVIFALFLVFGTNMLGGCAGGGSDVRLVREGYLQAHPDMSIGRAFDRFFGSPSWTQFTAISGERVVEFTGNFMLNNREVEAVIQFEIFGNNSFEIRSMEYNGIPQTTLEILHMINAIYR